MRTFLACFFLGLGLMSCTKEKFSADELSGYYRQIHETVTTPSGDLIREDSTRNATHLGLREDGFFYYNYYTGSWSVEGNTLRLSPNPGLLAEPWEYQIARVGEDLFQMRRTQTVPNDPNSATPGTVRKIVITELFRKEE